MLLRCAYRILTRVWGEGITMTIHARTRISIILLNVVLLSIQMITVRSVLAGQSDDIPSLVEIRQLRQAGEYVQAHQRLESLLTLGDIPEEDRRLAYNELVTIAFLTGGENSAMPVARTVLARYPDLEADPLFYPAEIQSIYDEIRKTMYGVLRLDSDPEQSTVYLDDLDIGNTPITGLHIAPGEYTLRIEKTGYAGDTLTALIKPAGETYLSVTLLPPERDVPQVGFGFEAGLSLVSLNYPNGTGGVFAGVGTIESVSSDLRFSASIFIHINPHERFAIQAGARLSSYGNKAEYNMTGDYESGEYKSYLQYLSLPILFKHYPISGTRLFVCAGLEPAYLLRASLSSTGDSGEIDIIEDLGRAQLFMDLGLGYESRIRERTAVMISLYYSFGVLSMRDETRWDNVDFRPREIRLSLGLLFQ